MKINISIKLDNNTTLISKTISDSNQKTKTIADRVFATLSSCLSAMKAPVKHFVTFIRAHALTSVQVDRIQIRIVSVVAAITALGALTAGDLGFSCACMMYSYGILLWYSNVIDYENPQELADIRKQALQAPFRETLEIHGLQKLMHYAILSPTDFFTSCTKTMNDLSFPKIIAFHEMLNDEYNKYPNEAYAGKIPEPFQWKDRFLQEVSGQSAGQILSRYSCEDLKKYRLIDEKMYADFIQIRELSKQLQTLDRKNKFSFDQQLSQLEKKMQAPIHKLQTATETKLLITRYWAKSSNLPSKQEIPAAFSVEERQMLRTWLSQYEKATKKVKEELKALQTHKPFSLKTV